MKYIKAEHYVLDFEKKTKDFIGTFYATREMALGQKKILVVSWASGQKQKFETCLEGDDLLLFKNYMEGNPQPISQGRFLNHDYEEIIFDADLPEKGLLINGLLTKISDTQYVTTKNVTKKGSDKILAVIQEILHYISKEEFEKATNSPQADR